MPVRIGHDVDEAARILAAGGLVGYPTDTLYGLGARIDRPEALARLFSVKRRPQATPVTVAVADVESIDRVGRMTPTARALLGELPGPLTLVLERTQAVPDVVTAGGTSVGIRVPAEPVCRALLAKTGPLTATSANVHGQPAASDAEDAAAALGDRVDYYLRGASAPSGVASTIVDARGPTPKILREGSIGAAEILRRTAHRGTDGRMAEGLRD
jgi:L-threonylcarbamoyladenylate synthase